MSRTLERKPVARSAGSILNRPWYPHGRPFIGCRLRRVCIVHQCRCWIRRAGCRSIRRKDGHQSTRRPSTFCRHSVVHSRVLAGQRSQRHPGVFDDDTIRAAFRMDQQMMIQASSGFSTISLSGTLSNLANKALLSAYNEIVSVIPRICRTATHSDFKSHTRYRVTSPGLLNKLGATGEIEHTELDEDTYSNQVETFARMMALTRQMMRNDDLNAFLQIPQMFGRMSARTKERSVFSVLLNNADSFFNTSPSGQWSEAKRTRSGCQFRSQCDVTWCGGNPVLESDGQARQSNRFGSVAAAGGSREISRCRELAESHHDDGYRRSDDRRTDPCWQRVHRRVRTGQVALCVRSVADRKLGNSMVVAG